MARALRCGMATAAIVSLAGCSTGRTGASARPTTARTTAPSAATTRAWQSVSFHRASFLAPPNWAVLPSGCKTGEPAVYIGDAVGVGSCGAFPPHDPPSPEMTLYSLDHPSGTGYRPVTINGNDGLMFDNGQSLLVVFPKLDLGVDILYWSDHALAERILNSMRVG